MKKQSKGKEIETQSKKENEKTQDERKERNEKRAKWIK